MTVSGKTRRARVAVKASAARDRAADLYDRYAAALYRQAVLTLGDATLAEQAVCDVIAAECARPRAPEDGRDDTDRRLVVMAYRRCRELAGGPRASCGGTDSAGPGGFLSAQEREALGLVFIGGLGCDQASGELMMSPRDLAALLRTALRRLAAQLKSAPLRPGQAAASASAGVRGASGHGAGLLQAGLDGEDAVQAGEAEKPEHQALRRGQLQVTACSPGLFPCPGQYPQTAAVDESQARQVDDDVRVAGHDSRERRGDVRGIGYVNLPAQRDDGMAVVFNRSDLDADHRDALSCTTASQGT
jgi:hypothetical protein